MLYWPTAFSVAANHHLITAVPNGLISLELRTQVGVIISVSLRAIPAHLGSLQPGSHLQPGDCSLENDGRRPRCTAFPRYFRSGRVFFTRLEAGPGGASSIRVHGRFSRQPTDLVAL